MPTILFIITVITVIALVIILIVIPACITPRRALVFLPYRLLLIALSGATCLLCMFGYLSTYEPQTYSTLPWRIGYACIGIASATTAVVLSIGACRALRLAVTGEPEN